MTLSKFVVEPKVLRSHIDVLCQQMGAHHFVETSKKGWEISLEQTFDLIISTTDCDDGFPLKEYLSTLRPLGRFITYVKAFSSPVSLHMIEYLYPASRVLSIT